MRWASCAYETVSSLSMCFHETPPQPAAWIGPKTSWPKRHAGATAPTLLGCARIACVSSSAASTLSRQAGCPSGEFSAQPAQLAQKRHTCPAIHSLHNMRVWHGHALCWPCFGRSVARAHVQPKPTRGSPSAARCAACRYAARAMAAAVAGLAKVSGTAPSSSAIAAGAYGTRASSTVCDAPGTANSQDSACTNVCMSFSSWHKSTVTN